MARDALPVTTAGAVDERRKNEVSWLFSRTGRDAVQNGRLTMYGNTHSYEQPRPELVVVGVEASEFVLSTAGVLGGATSTAYGEDSVRVLLWRVVQG